MHKALHTTYKQEEMVTYDTVTSNYDENLAIQCNQWPNGYTLNDKHMFKVQDPKDMTDHYLEDQDTFRATGLRAELMSLHYHLVHLSF